MQFLRVVLRSWLYFWPMHVTVACGVAAATAVLTGALLVGDSVRGSLRDLTLDRLGRVEEILFSDRIFRAELAAEVARDPQFPREYSGTVGAMLFPQATLERRTPTGIHRASQVLVVGSLATANVDDPQSFWSLARTGTPVPQRCPRSNEIILNRALADGLGATVGDELTLRLPKAEDIPADSPLGEKAERIRSFPRLQVIEIIAAEGLGRFSLTPAQSLPSVAFVALDPLQDGLEQPGKINTLLVAGTDTAPSQATSDALASALHPTLDDLGLSSRHVQLTFTDPQSQHSDTIYDYFSLSSQRMVLPPAVEERAAHLFSAAGGQPVFTYLANRLERVVAGAPSEPAQQIPYSTLAAIDLTPAFSLRSVDGQVLATPGPDEIILTDWAAEQMHAQVGDTIAVTYFEPETTHGASVENRQAFRVVAITPLAPPAEPYLPDQKLVFAQRPTMANDPHITPEVRGITDQKSIDDWEVPFTIDYKRIRPADDEYWEDYGTTPKAFISLAAGARLWGSRFGRATSYRIPITNAQSAAEIEQKLLAGIQSDASRLGFEFQPIKRQQLQASAGNTPFDVLFLMLSFFVIAAALLLVALLFRLGFEQRARQAGVLQAVGWRASRVRRLLVVEGLGVAIAGSLLGLALGLGYAALLLTALRSKSWWLGAVGTPFMTFHVTARSLWIGGTAGSLVSTLVIAWSVFLTRHTSARQLLAGQTSSAVSLVRSGRWSRWPLIAASVLLLGAIGLAFAAQGLSGQQQAGAFVGAGAAMLTSLLLGLWHALRTGGESLAPVTGPPALLRLAIRSAARSPGRSVLTIGLIATASFLIVAMSAFQLQPTETGTGGFSLIGESSQPIFGDLNQTTAREDLLADRAAVLQGSHLEAFRVRGGDDASCGNLYRARQPRILGVPASFQRRFDTPNQAAFQFTKAAQTDMTTNPWHVLKDTATPAGQPIPVVIDQETAMYSLQLYGGIGQVFSFEYDGRPLEFRVAGLLSLSILHGSLLISEADFQQQFPTISGYRYFLIETPEGRTQEVADVLEDQLGDQGFDVQDSRKRLADLMMLQNTYLSTFQSLGALGLLLGTLGLAAVQMRNVLERRGEMGLLRAAGFRRLRLSHLVLLENIMLLLAGLGTGVVAAILAVLPQLLGSGASIPIRSLASMLLVVLAVGTLAGLLASRATLRVPLLAALREER